MTMNENALMAELAEKSGEYSEAARLYIRAAKESDRPSTFRYYMEKNKECSEKAQILEWIQ